MSRHVVNHKEFTDRLALIASRKPPHIAKYITTVIRKFFLKNWERTEKIEKPPRGVPRFYGLSDREGRRHEVAIPFVIQTKNGPEVTTVYSDDPMYEQVKSGTAVFLDLDFMADIQNEIQDVLIWMQTVYSQPRDLTSIAYPDAKKKAKEWHDEEEKRRQRIEEKQKAEARRLATEGAEPIFRITAKRLTGETATWTVYNLSTESSLVYEGVRLHHCVAGYWPMVERKTTYIWSLREKPADPLLTLEVGRIDHELYQARGLQNTNPTHDEMVLIKNISEKFGMGLKLFPHFATPAIEQIQSVNIEKLNDIPGWEEHGQSNHLGV
jgi:hypothetical protein